MGLEVWLKLWSTCFANVKPRVQTPLPAPNRYIGGCVVELHESTMPFYIKDLNIRFSYLQGSWN
jgi:hypothetical protein